VLHAYLRNWIIYLVIMITTVWGVLLFIDDAPLNTIALGYCPLRTGRQAGLLYLGTAILTYTSMLSRFRNWKGLVMSMPMLYLLTVSAAAALHCMYNSSYFDMTPRPWTFITADQIHRPILVLVYIFSIFDWFVVSLRTK